MVVVIGGPNGAGKTTISRAVLADTLGITEFVNADALAAGLSGFDPSRAAFAAGRIMLQRLHGLADAGQSFAFESTLASRSFAPWLGELARRGWEVHVLYVWVRTPEIALRRIAARVRKGGHDIPSPVVRRRYARSASNLFRLYLPLADTWRIYDNSGGALRLVAHAGRGMSPAIIDQRLFAKLQETAAHAQADQNDQDRLRDPP
jgi:predicted ABC-type ATPase